MNTLVVTMYLLALSHHSATFNEKFGHWGKVNCGCGYSMSRIIPTPKSIRIRSHKTKRRYKAPVNILPPLY